MSRAGAILRGGAWPRRAASAILVAGWAAMLAAGAPGQMSYDSIVQLLDGRSGDYNTWHPAVMAWLLGLFDWVLPGTLLYLLFVSGLTLAALLCLLWLPRRRFGWGGALAAFAIICTPQWFLYQSIIWKDVLFADAALAGFAALAWAEAAWARRWPWLAASALLLVLGAMARQNGIVLLPVAATVLGLVAARHVPRKTALAYGAGFLLLTGALMFEANAILAAHGDHGSGARVELRIAQSYDLAGALKRQPTLVLMPLDKSAPALARLLRERGVPRYSTHRLDPIMNDEPTADAIHAAPRGVIFATWRDLVLHHPALYLAMRWPVFWQVLAEPRACTMIYTGIDGPAEEMKELGIAPQHSRRAWLLGYYAGRLMDMGVLSHLPFLALAAGLLVVLLRRREPADLAVAGLLAGALLFTFTFLVVSLACDYRYIYFLDLAAMAGALYVARGALRN